MLKRYLTVLEGKRTEIGLEQYKYNEGFIDALFVTKQIDESTYKEIKLQNERDFVKATK